MQDVKELIKEVEILLKDEFVAKITNDENQLKICFPDGKSFILHIEQL